MTVAIDVENSRSGRYHVTVAENGTRSRHVVSLSDSYYLKLTRKQVSQEELILRSFEFLLEREPKESILREFDLSEIGRYFPAYETEIQKRLSS